MTRVPATSSIKERAQMLEEAISEKYGGRQVNLVGHSMVCPLCQLVTSLTLSRVVSIVDTSSLNCVRRPSGLSPLRLCRHHTAALLSQTI